MNESENIKTQFRANLERVRSLVSLYEERVSGGRGRKPVPNADLLRAAVVLLHATLEDLLRSLAEWKLPTAPAGSFERIMFAGLGKPRDKITLVDLAEFRGKSVDEVITRSIEAYLEGSNYSHVGEVVELLEKIGVPYVIAKPSRGALAALMSRRHQIAHRADRNSFSGPGHQMAVSISSSLVKSWVGVVEVVGEGLLARV